MEKYIKKLVQSSENPENVSLTVKGILVSYIGLIVVILHLFGVPVTETQVLEVITQVSLAVGSAMTIVGALRKAYFAFK